MNQLPAVLLTTCSPCWYPVVLQRSLAVPLSAAVRTQAAARTHLQVWSAASVDPGFASLETSALVSFAVCRPRNPNFTSLWYLEFSVFCLPAEDPCLQRPCHPQASCTHIGPGQHICACHLGYIGDGRVCVAVDPCQTNQGGCSPKSALCVYDGPGQVSDWLDSAAIWGSVQGSASSIGECSQ